MSSNTPLPERAVSRRNLLVGTAGVVGAAFLRGAGIASAEEAPAARPGLPAAGSAGTPHQDLTGTITPSSLHYERHRAGIPSIDADRYELRVHGLVERPGAFRLADLKRLSRQSRTCFLECSGNHYPDAPEETTPQQLAGLTAQSEWTGVPLATLLREVGARPGAVWLVVEGEDSGALYSIPIEKAWDDALIAYAQNGEVLRPEHGYPARLVLPGWASCTSVKWIRRIELTDQPAPGGGGCVHEVSRGGAGPIVDVRSLITYPAYPVVLSPGWTEIEGLAWSGDGRISRVDVSTDQGRTWAPAVLQDPVLPKAHTRFRHRWLWNGEGTVILSRAVDEAGRIQPGPVKRVGAAAVKEPQPRPNEIVGWRIYPDGRVVLQAGKPV